MKGENLIETLNLNFIYCNSNQNVLSDLSLKINSGEFVSIVGGNGSGKSTLAKMFNALLIPTSGVVFVCAIDTSNLEKVFDVRKQVGMVFQNPDSQIVATLVEEDVAFAMENLCFEKIEMENRINKALSLVDMQNFKKSLVFDLSGGQKQRVAIAGVLAMNPKCIVFDEATSMIDPQGRNKVLNIMKALNDDGTTIINITHDMNEVVHSNRVVVLHDGKVLKDCSPKEFFSDEKTLKQANLKCLPVTELGNLLAKRGLLPKQTILSVDECVEVISKILEGSKSCL